MKTLIKSLIVACILTIGAVLPSAMAISEDYVVWTIFIYGYPGIMLVAVIVLYLWYQFGKKSGKKAK